MLDEWLRMITVHEEKLTQVERNLFLVRPGSVVLRDGVPMKLAGWLDDGDGEPDSVLVEYSKDAGGWLPEKNRMYTGNAPLDPQTHYYFMYVRLAYFLPGGSTCLMASS